MASFMMGVQPGIFRNLESNGLMGLRTEPIKEQGVVQCESVVLGDVNARKRAYGDGVATFPMKDAMLQLNIFRGDPLFTPSDEFLRRYGVSVYSNKPYVTASVNGLRDTEEITFQGVAVNSYPETASVIPPSQLMNMQVAGSVTIINTGTEQICAGSTVCVRLPSDHANENAVVRQADSIPTRLVLETYEVPVISRTGDSLQALSNFSSVSQQLSYFYSDPEFKNDYTALRPLGDGDAGLAAMPDDRKYADEIEANEPAKTVLHRLVETLQNDTVMVNATVQEDAQRLFGEFLDAMCDKMSERKYMNCALWTQYYLDKVIGEFLLDDFASRSRGGRDSNTSQRDQIRDRGRDESDDEEEEEAKTQLGGGSHVSKASRVALMQREMLRAAVAAASSSSSSSSSSSGHRHRARRPDDVEHARQMRDAAIVQRRVLNASEKARLDAMTPRQKFTAHGRVVQQIVTRRLMFQAEALQRLRTRNIMGMALTSANKGSQFDINLTLRHF